MRSQIGETNAIDTAVTKSVMDLAMHCHIYFDDFLCLKQTYIHFKGTQLYLIGIHFYHKI